MPRRNSLRKSVIRQYQEKRDLVKKILTDNTSKVSFTVDGWTSFNGRSYYGITAHFINNEWKMCSMALDFIPSCGQHTGKAIAEKFFKCVEFYQLEEKIQGITVDNASANTTFMVELSALMAKRGLFFDKINQHFRCFAHILNLGVQDVLKMLNIEQIEDQDLEVESDEIAEEETEDSLLMNDNDGTDVNEDSTDINPAGVIYRLRQTFVKIRRSEQVQNTLKHCCSVSKVKYKKPILDVKTRWNSTHDMMDVGLQLKPALKLLWSSDKQELSKFEITDQEWDLLQQIHIFLENFKAVSEKLGGDKYVTLPLVIVAFNMLLNDIEKKVSSLDKNVERSTVDEILLLAFQQGRDKMLKHYYLTNWVYCAVLVLDPRHKVETFSLTSWGREMEKKSIKQFEKIYSQYANANQNNSDDTNVEDKKDNKNNDGYLDDILDFNALYEDSAKERNWQEELKEYLSLKRATKDEDILEWWRHNEKSFPTLAKMARDLFSITATSVPVERLFSLAGQILTKTRNSMNDESIRALLCLNTWYKSGM